MVPETGTIERDRDRNRGRDRDRDRGVVVIAGNLPVFLWEPLASSVGLGILL